MAKVEPLDASLLLHIVFGIKWFSGALIPIMKSILIMEVEE